jgi:hypothetical protein
MGEVAGLALRQVGSTEGRSAAWQLLQKVLRCPSPGGSFFQAVLKLESEAPVDEQLPYTDMIRIFEVSC